MHGHHLADAELFRSVRLRQLLAEDDPRLPTFDQEHTATKVDYSRPIEGSLALLRAAMDANLELIRALPEQEWQRSGHQDGAGTYTLDDWLQRAANHGFEHAGQLEANAAWHAEGVHSNP